ncbi:hypothetical protein FAZ19_14480 [Sphingobacterium alkalisoli]|uniref:Chromosome partitioning protein ParA n=1 Tax=Sphingobacterium alkalisoli TaxID=1874115 RepID=A0A4U0GYX6_9SPHI|nr:hypothetical protein [Sphingobacterium alkalisoli]TJY64405.1 hypothetical protein FAZ19_14480 [Sphingobacterium alkalisoli]GGH21959.1 hypothetical protein GCM10011418_28180 [Sphingobacterium alkalisoli]
MEVKSANRESGASEEKRDNSKIYFFIIAIVALLLTNVYFYVKFKSSGEKLYTVTLEKESLQIEIDRIEAELDNLSNQDIALSGDIMASEREARNIIEGLRQKLEISGISEEELESARQQVVILKSNVANLKVNMNELKLQNDMLARENELLSSKVRERSQHIEEISKKNKDLNDKVNIASSIKVSNIQVNGIEISRRGNIEIETKAKRVDELQIKFTIADNPLAVEGNKDIFIRVIDPQGNLIANANNVFYIHGDKLQYSTKETIRFTNRGEEYQFLWKDSAKGFKKGAYTVLLYADNAIMGRSSVVLK